ncbi:MAG: hydroxymethylglutaryl-CoA lyase [Pseudomonadota bacterium]
MTDRIQIIEMGPRDGLQNEKQTVPVETKIELVNRLSATGLDVIEAGAFVSPKWVPQMAASDEVLAGIERRPDVSCPVLTPNMKGYEAARAAGADAVAVFAAASETFSQKNTNCSIAESFERFAPILEAAKADGVRVRGYVSCVLGCPFEGKIDPEAVAWVTKHLHEAGCYEISLGDTIGVGTAGEVFTLIERLKHDVPVANLAGHFHDTYGQALANIRAGMEAGVTVFDASVSGLGGCPYAPGATGNVATDDVIYMAHGSGVETGVDFDKLIETSLWISETLGRRPASKVATAIMAKRA